jgi:hypothetical protein
MGSAYGGNCKNPQVLTLSRGYPSSMPVFSALFKTLNASDILKIVAALITAASGTLGLLKNFKRKVTRKPKKKPEMEVEVLSTAGKIALVGILAGTSVSILLIVLDARGRGLANKEHQHEYGVLTQPLSHEMLATIWYESETDQDDPKSAQELPDLGNIVFARGQKSCSRATSQSGDLQFAPEIVASRDFGGSVPEFLITSPNFHSRSYVQESRKFQTSYLGDDPLLGFGDLSDSTIVIALYGEEGVTKFDLRAIELPVATGKVLQLDVDSAKLAKDGHDTIVDESKAWFGEKPEKPKHIVEYYYCFSIPKD